MLDIINNLKIFIEDCYRRVNVREYSRAMKISPPTASKILFKMNKEGLLRIERDRNYIFFYANKEKKDFIDLSRIYWNIKLEPLTELLEKNLVNPTIVLFGSLAKAETKKDSDIDLAIFAHKQSISLEKFERLMKRKIQPFWFESINAIKNKQLANNILNGCIIKGKLKL